MLEKLNIYSIQRFCLHDGPGIRTTVFLKGCPLNCLWCHNIESINPKAEIAYQEKQCLLKNQQHCQGNCAKNCPSQAISIDKNTLQFDFNKCNACGKCEDSCPKEVFEKIGYQIGIREIFKSLKLDESFYKASKGGITISGGEPLNQAKTLAKLFQLCKQDNLHTLIETSAAARWKDIEEVIPFVDQYQIDIKTSRQTHEAFTGMNQDAILKNIKRMLDIGLSSKIEFRMPVVPTINDKREIVEEIANTLKELKKQELTLLPQNKFWEAKVDRLKTRKSKLNIKKDNAFAIEEVTNILKENGIKVKIPITTTLLDVSSKSQQKQAQNRPESEKNSFSERIRSLKKAVQNSQVEMCLERAEIANKYQREKANRKKSPQIQRAEVMKTILSKMSTRIWDNEILVGNFHTKRVGANIMPEFAGGIAMALEAHRIDKRPYNSQKISSKDRWKLVKMMPFWVFKNLLGRTFKGNVWEYLKFSFYTLKLEEMFLPEIAGYGHMLPKVTTLLEKGTAGLREIIKQKCLITDDPNRKAFYKSLEIVCDGLDAFADRQVKKAKELLKTEINTQRISDLKKIIEVCSKIPLNPARTFHEALQAILFLHIALNLDNLDNGISPGRLDYILEPQQTNDIQAGRMTKAEAKELLAAFCIKFCEIIPSINEKELYVLGGLSNGQTISIGGVNEKGNDITNDLTYLFLEIMQDLRLRQPLFQARYHRNAPEKYMLSIAKNLRNGSASPALQNDDVWIPLLQNRGQSLEEARDQMLQGCVEPVSCGRCFGSTDSALINCVICLERALNLKKSKLKKKQNAEKCENIEQVWSIFAEELAQLIEKQFYYQRKVETAIQKYQPVPLFSLFLEGCIEKGIDASLGGTKYNSTGPQAIGCADIGDSFAAIEKVVFQDKKCTMSQLITALKANFKGYEEIQGQLMKAPKFGNNDPNADKWMQRFLKLFYDLISSRFNLRGGMFQPGQYSMTLHIHFGKKTKALPSGRMWGEPFAAGITPSNSSVRKGPTAILNSICTLDNSMYENGCTFNFTLDKANLEGEDGAKIVKSLLVGYMNNKGPQAQVNIFDPKILLEAKKRPEHYPFLVVRVSGQTAYWRDLTPDMQEDIIRRFNSK